MILPHEFSTTFIRKIQRTKEVWSFSFDKKDYEFVAGQYIRLTLSEVENDPRGKFRLFSCSSSPLESEIMITTTISQSIFKQTLSTLSIGSDVKIFGPAGRMVLHEKDPSPCIFLAGGIGITPFRSMLLYAAGAKLSIPITFFVSFSTREEMLFYDELIKVPQQNPNIKVVYTITHSENVGSDWRGEVGRISKEMIEKYVQNAGSSKAYIAGPPAMVTAMQEIVVSLGIPPEKTLKENFVGY